MKWIKNYVLKTVWFVVFSVLVATFITAGSMISKQQKQANPKDLRILIHSWVERLEKDTEEFPEIIAEFSQHTENCTDRTLKAVMHSMASEMYKMYYENHQWAINSRTQLEGDAPDDLRIWSTNLFMDAMSKHSKLSLEPTKLLKETPIDAYKDLLIKDKEALPVEFPSLYDFLVWRMLDISYDGTIAAAWLKDLEKDAKQPFTILAKLQVLEKSKTANYPDEAYNRALNNLYETYKEEPFSVEIVNRIAEAYRMYQITEKQDSIIKARYLLLTKSIERFPDYPRINLLKSKLAELTRPYLHTRTPINVYPEGKLDVKITYRNIPEVTILIEENTESPLYPHDRAGSKKGKVVKQVLLTLPEKAPYEKGNDTTISIPISKPGLYNCIVTANNQSNVSNKTFFSVSKMGLVYRTLAEGKIQAIVTDFSTGKPLDKTTVIAYKNDRGRWAEQARKQTGEDGIVLFSDLGRQFGLRAVSATDTSSIISSMYSYDRQQGEKERPVLDLFTDRSIYRPGQTVYLKGIAYSQKDDQSAVIAHSSYTLNLYDTSGNAFDTHKVKTNEFGSFSYEFQLPQTSSTGWFRIESESGSTSFRVEEYKRPTFIVEVDTLKERLAFDRPMTIRGNVKTYSGVAIKEGTIKYEVHRRRMPWRWFYPEERSEEMVDHGEATFNDKGEFSFQFTPEKQTSRSNFPNRYEVLVFVTDTKGETQQGNSYFSVFDKEFSLYAELPERVSKDNMRLKVAAQTANGNETEVNGQYKLIELIDKDNKNVSYEDGQIVQEGSFNTLKVLEPEVFTSVPSGRYRLLLEAKDSEGQSVEYTTNFILYDKNDKRPPVFSYTWLTEREFYAEPGEEITCRFGTSVKNAYVLYEVFSEGQTIKQAWERLNNEIETFKITMPTDQTKGLTVSFTFIKEGEMYSELVTIHRKQPDRKLTIKPTTFRDHLIPGQRETWTFTILDADSNKVKAEVLASMYDFSLDQIQKSDWHFSPWQLPALSYNWLQKSRSFEENYANSYGQYKSYRIVNYGFYTFDWQQLPYLLAPMNVTLQTRSMVMSDQAEMAPVMKAATPVAKAKNEAMAAGALEEDAVAEESMEQTISPLRENFRETAFFYPHLVQENDVSFTFILPESNTTWKLRMLAHTKDLLFGMHTANIIASKQLMVSPNLPRFVREGDQVVISTQIHNRMDIDLAGNVRLSLFDPVRGEALDIVPDSVWAFDTKGGESTDASWRFTVPHGISMLGCKIMADTDQASDGEQHLIPVLPEDVWVVESKPIMLSDQKQATIQLPDMTGGKKKPFRATIEVATHPIWYAIQALPSLSEPTNEDAISWLGAYYAATLTDALIRQNPRIEQMVAVWKASATQQETLLSNLEKNKELKTTLLQETPWMTAAKNESENKQKLALLFDKNRTQSIRMNALNQLDDLQKEDGGWGWYSGFSSNPSITLQILQGMAELTALQAVEYGQREKEMQIKALKYMDDYVGKQYEKMLKLEKEHSTLSAFIIDYLFMRSHYRDIPETASGRTASRYYTSLIPKEWNKPYFTLQQKGKAAMLLHRNGDKESALKIVAWLKRTATTNNKGMYWANNRADRNALNGSPVSTHTILMRALQEVAPNLKETNQMKLWLLGQKRVQHWGTTPATLSAINQLVEQGSDWLNDSGNCDITWGDWTFNSRDGEAGTGYIKKTVESSELTAAMNKLNITRTGDSPLWGAAYVEYFQPASEVKASASTGLSVDKKLFLEVNKNGKKTLQPIEDGGKLHVGDRITVRITVRSSDRYDFVHLKDLRPACFEPANQLSSYEFAGGAHAYHTSRDAAEEYFFERLPQGTFVLEYSAYVNREGVYSEGMASIQSQYAPEFTQHSSGGIVEVVNK